MPPYRCTNPACGKQGKRTASAKCTCGQDNEDLAAGAAAAAVAALVDPGPPVVADKSAEPVFTEVRQRLGTPLNDPKWKNVGNTRHDESAVGDAYTACKKAIGISENDQERNSKNLADRETWMVRSAALGWVAGAGVCNNFGALTAILLRIREVPSVKMVGTDQHNWAEYGDSGISVDPWLHQNYAVTRAAYKATLIVDLSLRPAEHYWRLLAAEIQNIRPIARKCGLKPDTALPEPPGVAPKASPSSSSTRMKSLFGIVDAAQKGKEQDDVALFEAGLQQTHTIQRTVGDGNCLFRALSVGLYGHQDQHLALRAFAVGDMRHNPGEYTPYGVVVATHTAVMAQPAAGADDVDRWGGGLEIYAIARVFHRRIIVHSPIFASGQLVFGDTREGGPDVHVYYKGRNHYDGMRRR